MALILLKKLILILLMVKGDIKILTNKWNTMTFEFNMYNVLGIIKIDWFSYRPDLIRMMDENRKQYMYTYSQKDLKLGLNK